MKITPTSIMLMLFINFIDASFSSQTNKISDIVQQYEALHGEARINFYENLPEETRQAIAAFTRERSLQIIIAVEEEKKRRNDLLSQGTGPLWEQIWFYYRAVGRSAVSTIVDAEERKDAEQSMKEKLECLNQAIGSNSPENNAIIWKKYKPVLESVAKQFPWKSVDRAALTQIEAKLIQPLIKDLEESARQDTP